jgi:hypothetical protein
MSLNPWAPGIRADLAGPPFAALDRRQQIRASLGV